jgi:hypothetical protein
MSHGDEQAHLREISLWMLYVGLCALTVPAALFGPDFLSRILVGDQVYKSALLLFGPYLFVWLLSVGHDHFGRPR